MTHISRTSKIAALAFTLALPGVAASAQATQATQAPVQGSVRKHHSKLKGAVAGAAAGHMLGGHAVAGAAVGAMVQHHKNHKRP